MAVAGRQMAMTRRQPARNRLPPIRERATHIAVVRLLKQPGLVNPRDWQWTHIPLGEKREPKTGALLQDMGTKPGWPDLIFLHRLGFVYFLEFKSAIGELGASQFLFRQSIRHFENVHFAVARSIDESIDVLVGWGVLERVNTGRRNALGEVEAVTSESR